MRESRRAHLQLLVSNAREGDPTTYRSPTKGPRRPETGAGVSALTNLTLRRANTGLAASNFTNQTQARPTNDASQTRGLPGAS